MRKTDLAWTAGIIDGEGCIHIRKSQAYGAHLFPRYELNLSVRMCHEGTIRRLQALFGGTIFYEKGDETRLERWNWSPCRTIGGEVLQKVKPYLVTKKLEAKAALEFLEIPNGRRGIKTPDSILALREKFYLQVRKLKFCKNNLFIRSPIPCG